MRWLDWCSLRTIISINRNEPARPLPLVYKVPTAQSLFIDVVAVCVMHCRPEPQRADLADTAITIWQAAHATTPDAAKAQTLQAVATAYYQPYCHQSHPDFHGLRDFYVLINTLRLQPQLAPTQLYSALLHNFGGPAQQVEQVSLKPKPQLVSVDGIAANAKGSTSVREL